MPFKRRMLRGHACQHSHLPAEALLELKGVRHDESSWWAAAGLREGVAEWQVGSLRDRHREQAFLCSYNSRHADAAKIRVMRRH